MRFVQAFIYSWHGRPTTFTVLQCGDARKTWKFSSLLNGSNLVLPKTWMYEHGVTDRKCRGARNHARDHHAGNGAGHTVDDNERTNQGGQVGAMERRWKESTPGPSRMRGSRDKCSARQIPPGVTHHEAATIPTARQVSGAVGGLAGGSFHRPGGQGGWSNRFHDGCCWSTFVR